MITMETVQTNLRFYMISDLKTEWHVPDAEEGGIQPPKVGSRSQPSGHGTAWPLAG